LTPCDTTLTPCDTALTPCDTAYDFISLRLSSFLIIFSVFDVK
jgi:hypothetical protein